MSLSALAACGGATAPAPVLHPVTVRIPVAPGAARPCVTVADCGAGEVCAVLTGVSPTCAPAPAGAPAAAGPEGQPPPPVGLLQGAGRLAGGAP